MKTIFVVPPYNPLLQVENENIDNSPNSDQQPQKTQLIPSFSFFLKSSSCLFLDYELFVLKKPKTLQSCLEIVALQKAKKLVFDVSDKEYFEDKYQNTLNIIHKIKQTNPEIKISIIRENEEVSDYVITKEELLVGKFEERNLKKILEFKKYILRSGQRLCVVQDLVSLMDVRKILNLEFYNFHFYNVNSKNLKDIVALKKDYFDLEYVLNANLDSLDVAPDFIHVGAGLEKAILRINFNGQIKDKIIKIKNLLGIAPVEISIIPNIKETKTLELIEFLEYLDEQKIKYQIQKTKEKVEEKKQFYNFGVTSLLSSLNAPLGLKNRFKEEIPIITEKSNFENIIDFIIKAEHKYLEIYIDVAHFLEGLFTKKEIINYLQKLHPNSKKEKIEKIVCECINLLEKELLIDYLNSKTEKTKDYQKHSHYLGVFPKQNNLFLMYTASEKGYIFTKNKKELEEVPKDIFFFFVFSKGIFVLKEVAHKLHLLFKDTKEFSKENYLKSTKKLYNTLKHYGLCK